jgi:hypothetical protein
MMDEAFRERRAFESSLRELSAGVIALPNGVRKVRRYALSAHLLAERVYLRPACCAGNRRGLDGGSSLDSKGESNLIILLEKIPSRRQSRGNEGILNQALQAPIQRLEI